MNAIKKIKKETLLTQQHIADYLGVSRSFIGAVEAGNKSLSADSLIKLSGLYIQFKQNNTDKIKREIAEEESKLIIFLQQQNTAKQHRKTKLEKQLNTMQSNYNKALQLIQTTRSLQTNATAKDILCLQVMEATAKEILQKNNLVEQKKLEIKIEKNYL